jgi:hypothetical protein
MNPSSRSFSLDPSDGGWLPLPLDAWKPTYQTLHRWTQIVGKVRLALAPAQNHWWQVPLYVAPRGLATSAIPYGDRSFEMVFDLVDHDLVVTTSDGRRKMLPLLPRSVADFYREVMALLDSVGIDVHIWTTPVEIPTDAIPFEQDRQHADYDAVWATRCFRALQHADLALKTFASRFQGKQSPVHFFWGSFDLAYTRFSGRRAPPRPGADRITREAYSHEVASFGFWPGSEGMSDAAFYAYAAPEPEGVKDVAMPTAGLYDRKLNEFLLPYDEVRRTRAPHEVLLGFYQGAYEAIARLGGWDRAALDRVPEPAPDGGAPGAEEHWPEQPAP